MDLVLDTAPAVQPVTLADIRALLNYDATDRDAVLEGLLEGVIQGLDGWSGTLGRALISQTWVMHLERFPTEREIEFPLPPLRSVGEVAYLDTNGVRQVLDPSTYVVVDGEEAELELLQAYAWPATLVHPRAVSITFTCGYGSAAADVPGPIRTAIKLEVAAQDRGEATDPAVAALLKPFRLPHT